MARIKIEDLPMLEELSKKETKGIFGGSGISQEMSLSLQITMDRRSKVTQTLSNIMKKISTTQDVLVQNIK